MKCEARRTTRLRNIGTFGEAESPSAENVLADLAKSPTSHAAGSSRSNMIALHHTIELMHGEAALEHAIRDGRARGFGRMVEGG